MEQLESQEFLTSLRDLASSLANASQTPRQVDKFIEAASKRKRLPQSTPSSSQQIIGEFLVTLLSLISIKGDNLQCARLIKLLHTYLKNDVTVFNAFSVNKPLIRKLNLEIHIVSKAPLEREAALEISVFIMKFYKQVDFGDFSSDPVVVSQIRREVDYRIQKDLQQIQQDQNSLESQMESLKNASVSAFQEMSSKFLNQADAQKLMEKLKTEIDQLAYSIKKDSGNVNHETYQRLEELIKAQKTETDKKFAELQKGNSNGQREIITQLGQKIQTISIESAEQRSRLEEIVGRELDQGQSRTNQMFAAIQQDVVKNQALAKEEQNRVVSQLQGRFETDQLEYQQKILKLILEIEKKNETGISDIARQTKKDLKDFVSNLDTENIMKELADKFQAAIKSEQIRAVEKENEIQEELQDTLRKQLHTMNNTLSERVSQLFKASDSDMKKLQQDTSKKLSYFEKALIDNGTQANTSFTQTIERQRQEFFTQLNDLQTSANTLMQQYVDEQTQSVQKNCQLQIEQKLMDSIIQISKVIDGKVSGVVKEVGRKIHDKIESMENIIMTLVDSKVNDVTRSMASTFERKIESLHVDINAHFEGQLQDLQTKLRAQILSSVQDSQNAIDRTIEKNFNQFQIQITRENRDLISDSSSSMKQFVEERVVQEQLGTTRQIDQKVQAVKDSTGKILDRRLQEQTTFFRDTIESKVKDTETTIKIEFDRKLAILQNDNTKFIELQQQILEHKNNVSVSLSGLTDVLLKRVDEKLAAQLADIQRSIDETIQRKTDDLYRETQQRIQDIEITINREQKTQINAIQNRLDESEARSIRNIESKLREINGDLEVQVKKSIMIATEAEKTLTQELVSTRQEVDQRIQAMQKVMSLMEQELNSSMDNKIMLFEKQIERSLQKQISDNAKELKLYVEMEVKDLKFVFSNLERGLQKTDKAVFESAGKVERMEKGLREQITFISKINDSVQVTDQKMKEGDKSFETHMEEIQRQFKVIQTQNSRIKTAVAQIDAFAIQSQTQSSAINDAVRQVSDLKIRINDEILPRLDILITTKDKQSQRIDFVQSETEKVNLETRLQLDQVTLRHTNALALLDVKSQKLIGQVQRIEEEILIQIDRQLKELDRQNIMHTKDTADLLEKYRAQFNELANFKELVTSQLQKEFDTISEALRNHQILQQESGKTVKAEMDNLKLELSPFKDQVKNLNQTLGQLSGMQKGYDQLGKHMDQIVESVKNDRAGIDQLRLELEQVNSVLGELDRLGQLVEEANKLWVFFQKFIDEQAMDQVKNIRSPDIQLTPKITSLEWFARYAEYITPGTLTLGVQTFSNLFNGQNQADLEVFKVLYHHQEAIPTCIQNIRNLKAKIDSDLIGVDMYDQNNAMLLMVMEPLLSNDLCLDMTLKINGMIELCRIVMEQPLPSELKDKVDDIEFSANYVNSAYQMVLRCLVKCTRSERGVVEFLANSAWITRVLSMLDEWSNEETNVLALNIVRNTLKNESTFDKVAAEFPNLGNYVLATCSDNADSFLIVSQCVGAFRNFSRKPQYLQNIIPPKLVILMRLINIPAYKALRPRLLDCLRYCSKNATLKKEIDRNGGIPS